MKRSYAITLVLTLSLTGSLSCFSQQESIGDKKVVMVENGTTMRVPYYSNHVIEEGKNEITSAVVVVHGVNRNADDYYNNMVAAASLENGVLDRTIIVAPQFLKEEDIDFNSLDASHLYWLSVGWRFGNNSLSAPSNPRPESMSSYAVIDTILLRLAANYPNLHRIVVTGHSGGGQVANRYAASNSVSELLWSNYEIGTRYIVMNPSSYVYMDNRRAVSGTTDQFEVPSTCGEYDTYGYGLNGLHEYQAAVGATNIRTRYGMREVVYLLGQNDNNPNSSSLDTKCQANLQGDHRLARGSIYFNHVVSYYGQQIKSLHSIDTVLGVGHSHSGMFASNEGRNVLFRKPLVQEPLVADFTLFSTIGCSQSINFQDASFGSATSWSWDFGNGTTSSEQNPVYAYSDAGTYQVSLEIGKEGELNSVTKEIQVTFNDLQKPVIEELNGRLLTNSSGDTFQWSLNGELLEGETSRVLSTIPQKDDEVTVEAFVGACSAISDSYLVLSAVEASLTKMPFSVYPNPVLDQMLNIQSIGDQQNLQIQVVGTGGKVFKRMNKSRTQNDQVISVPLQKLDSGLYFLIISTEKGTYREKILISR